MDIFSRTEKGFDLEQHLQSVVGKCYERVSEEQKNKLLERIISDDGNKRYIENENHTHYIDEKHGQKVYDVNDLTCFPDWQSDKDFPPNIAYSIGSKEHEDSVKKIEDLIKQFTNNDSNVANDLRKLLENSEIRYRVLNKWETPNGNCSFKRAEQKGAKNQIVICICDLGKTGDEVLPEILAHELGHALEFSQRFKGAEAKYMDGCETAADLIGASLLANAGIKVKGFSEFMEKDYQGRKSENKDTQMFYSPDGKYRKENFDLAYEIIENVKHKDSQFRDTSNTKVNKIKMLRGLASDKPRSVSKESLQSLRYVPNQNNRGR